jgi:hypothetical protein
MKNLFIALSMLSSVTLAYESLQGPTELLYWNREKAFNGYTLFAAHGKSYLIDMEGQLVHQWRLGTNPRFLDNGNLLDATKDNPSSFKGFQEIDWDGNVIWEYEETRPNHAPHHDFVRIFNKKLNAPTTLYISGKTITREMALAIGVNPAKAPSEGGEGSRGGRLAKGGKTMVDAIVEVDMDGNIVWEWCFFDHLVQDMDPEKPNYVANIADAPHRLNMNLPGKGMRGDWLHCNSMDYNPELGHIVINSVQGEFYVIDHDGTFIPGDPAKSIELAAGPAGDFLYRFGDPARYEQGDRPSINENWTKGSSGHKQIGGSHDVQWIDAGLPGAGNLLIFNNGQYLFEQTAQSYIYEIDGMENGRYVNPPDAGYVRQSYHPDMHKTPRNLSKQIVWLYGSKSNQGFFSHIGAGCQRLPNGNTLICSDTEGHFFEVTPECELAWEYINPITKEFGVLKTIGDMIPMANSAFRCYRYPADHPALKNRDLTPKGLITDVVDRPVRRDPSEEKFPQPGDVMSGPGPKPVERRSRVNTPPATDAEQARPAGGGGGDRFARMDTNSDGSVSFEELYTDEKEKRGGELDETRTRKKFEEIDTDKDGSISQAEMDKAPKGKGGKK